MPFCDDFSLLEATTCADPCPKVKNHGAAILPLPILSAAAIGPLAGPTGSSSHSPPGPMAASRYGNLQNFELRWTVEFLDDKQFDITTFSAEPQAQSRESLSACYKNEQTSKSPFGDVSAPDVTGTKQSTPAHPLLQQHLSTACRRVWTQSPTVHSRNTDGSSSIIAAYASLFFLGKIPVAST